MIKEVVKKSPYFIQKPAKYIFFSIPDKIRYGKLFREKYKFLNKSQWWTEEQHEAFQLCELKKLIKHAYENVPYYTRIFNERNLKPYDIKSFRDMKKIPYLTKEIIQQNLEDLIAKNYERSKLQYVTTGGSTGMPMGFFVQPKVDRDNEWAFIANLWSRIGYDIGKVNRSVILRGNIPRNNKFYEYKGRDLILSSFYLNDKNSIDYIRMIKKFNPDFIQAYPSTISMLSKYILTSNTKLELTNIKAILCSSENLYESQRRDIELAFGVRVYSFYGHTEHACLAGECEKSNYYHIESEYGYTELLDDNGEKVYEEDAIGELVVTGFNNYVIPFIRYKTGDIVINTNKKCECGRSCKIIKGIEGRKQDYFIDRYGEKVTFIYHDVPIWKFKEKIRAYQYVQNLEGKVKLNIQVKDYISEKELMDIEKEFLTYYPNFDICISIVTNIDRTSRGKFRFLIQNIGR